ncbi:single-stranded DNA-binding protein [Jeotgalibacillus soli]|uniref:Single-stranded DNA-binding protein n=1 Tax=Jeotgalibacillus soli TaxID=889306 RepID=A0A0C2VZ32_9BACL|nr:single-stranded DNA-binding protein [Jeotgalibacillus soli]KIL49213.1 single-stranded DNA-binding protein [Jeotgalibacillus soli]
MMNRVVLVGRLTKDPDLRYTPNGVPVATFTLAVNRSFTNQQGDREADFINCVVWRRPAENVANFLKKGSLAGVDGRVQSRSYDNQEGKRVYVTEIVAESVQFLEPRNASSGESGGGYGENQGYQGNQSNQSNQSNNFGQNQPRENNQKNQNYTRVDQDPFSNDGQPIDISDDDLPF